MPTSVRCDSTSTMLIRPVTKNLCPNVLNFHAEMPRIHVPTLGLTTVPKSVYYRVAYMYIGPMHRSSFGD